MSDLNQGPNGREAMLAKVMEAAQSLTQDWGCAFADPLGPQTRLVADLGYQSLDIVVLVVGLCRQLQRTDIPELLLADAKAVGDISLGTLADFLWEQTRQTPSYQA